MTALLVATHSEKGNIMARTIFGCGEATIRGTLPTDQSIEWEQAAQQRQDYVVGERQPICRSCGVYASAGIAFNGKPFCLECAQLVEAQLQRSRKPQQPDGGWPIWATGSVH